MRRAAAHVALAAVLVGAAAPAAERWQTLPPTPALPAGTVGHHLEVDGARLWYASWGPAGGEPVLLLHGGPLNSAYFGELIPVLVRHGQRVIALDSRGQGRSTRGGVPMSYGRMADDALALLDHLHLARASIVGWSDGGVTGLELARRHPARVRRLFAFGANADPSGGADPGAADPVVAAYHARAQEEYRALSPAPGEWQALEAAMARMWETEPNLSAAELAAIRVPVTVADGEHEEFVRPEHTRYLARTIPGARLVILRGVSHFALLQDPAAFAAAVLEFLGT